MTTGGAPATAPSTSTVTSAIGCADRSASASALASAIPSASRTMPPSAHSARRRPRRVPSRSGPRSVRPLAREGGDRGHRLVAAQQRGDEHVVGGGERERGRPPVARWIVLGGPEHAGVDEARRQPGDRTPAEAGRSGEFAAGRGPVDHEVLEDEDGVFAVRGQSAGRGWNGCLADVRHVEHAGRVAAGHVPHSGHTTRDEVGDGRALSPPGGADPRERVGRGAGRGVVDARGARGIREPGPARFGVRHERHRAAVHVVGEGLRRVRYLRSRRPGRRRGSRRRTVRRRSAPRCRSSGIATRSGRARSVRRLVPPRCAVRACGTSGR